MKAEKSRLRSAATHYKISTNDSSEEVLMLKGKEVVGDPKRQYEIAREVHLQQDNGGKGHSGINKTTATISEKYHWERIKATVSVVIKNCSECKASIKAPSSRMVEDTPTDNTELSEAAPNTSEKQPSHDTNHAQTRNDMHSIPDPNVVPFTDQQAPGISLAQLELNNGQNGFDDFSYGDLDDFTMPIDPRILENMGSDVGAFDTGHDPFADLPPIDDFTHGHLPLDDLNFLSSPFGPLPPPDDKRT